MSLHEVMRQFVTAANEVKEATRQKNFWKKKVLRDFDEQGLKSYDFEGYHVSLSVRQTVKYDQKGMEEYLLSKFTSDEIHKKDLDMKKVETLICEGRLDPEELMNFSEVKTIEALYVKEVSDEPS